jgi:hypothetical protein
MCLLLILMLLLRAGAFVGTVGINLNGCSPGTVAAAGGRQLLLALAFC